MDTKNLYVKYDYNGEPIFYTDSDCTILYTGHIEDYNRDGSLCMEADVVDGFKKGIYKQYFFKSNQLEQISYYDHNVQYGLEMEFYENGRVKYLTIAICNDYADIYSFSEDGQVLKKKSGQTQVFGVMNNMMMKKLFTI